MSFYSTEELRELGLKSYGNNVLISKYARIYGSSNIVIGNNVRIDDFCIISAGIAPFVLEDYIHISAGTYIYGQYGFHMKSFTNISGGCKIYTQSDTFTGECMVGSTVPLEYRKIKGSPMIIEKHVSIGAGSIVLPGVLLNEGVAIGANSLVINTCEPWRIYAGSPAKFIKDRGKHIIHIEKEFMESIKSA